MFKNPFSFSGRIQRGEYALSFLIYIAIAILFNLLVDESVNPLAGLLALVLLLGALWFLYAQGAKRCHDVGRSGWFQLIPFYIIVLLMNGSVEDNEYGPNPNGELSNPTIDSV